MRLISALFLIISLTACATMDTVLGTKGIITEETSQFDGKRIVNLTPAIIEHGGFSAGLYWDSDKEDRAFFKFAIDGAHSFVPDEPLLLKIDGRLVSLPPVRPNSYGEIEYDDVLYENVSSKDYWITKEDVKAFYEAKETTYRVVFRKGFHEGSVNYDWDGYKSYAATGFKNFYAKVWGG